MSWLCFIRIYYWSLWSHKRVKILKRQLSEKFREFESIPQFFSIISIINNLNTTNYYFCFVYLRGLLSVFALDHSCCPPRWWADSCSPRSVYFWVCRRQWRSWTCPKWNRLRWMRCYLWLFRKCYSCLFCSVLQSENLFRKIKSQVLKWR